MKDISTTLKNAIYSLKRAGVLSPELDARVLLEAALKKDHTFIVLKPNYILSIVEVELYEAYIKRRSKREPVAKIVGEKEFWSLPFKTTKDTLDPRPDSEVLIEAVLSYYKNHTQPYRILDLGTGTGCLLLTLLSEYKHATGVGVDCSQKALDVAKYNSNRLNMADRSSFLQSNWSDKVDGLFDIIISNPPYIPPSNGKSLEPELSFDPKQALYGEDTLYDDLEDGLSAYRILSNEMGKHLKPESRVFLEFGQDQHDDVKGYMEQAGFKHLSFHKDLSGIIRAAVFSISSS